ncbi:aspartate-semialdehyde dehydrogenase [Candidatus Woesearchaeota archaeon]|nr:aspartate-semialdehyde dehydrogenase [Candidatus Woesearchaeota archaeon]
MKKVSVGVLGATGMVGQRFISLLELHPWFEVNAVAASPRSAGRKYSEAVGGRWFMPSKVPDNVAEIKVQSVEDDLKSISGSVDLVFSALDMDKSQIVQVENSYANAGVAVVSNNSAHRWTEDVPMIMPEINHHHAKLIDFQRENRGWDGLIAVKPNCSIQSYVPAIDTLMKFGPKEACVTTFQAISGAGKTFESWPEMADNVIPFIRGEEEKSEKEPMKIWGTMGNGRIELATAPRISASCIRVPVSDGHLASVSVSFDEKPAREEILASWNRYINPLKELELPSEPSNFIRYMEQDDRPQTRLDRDFESGMGVTVGRLREDTIFDWKFVSLSHNTIRGAAGGAILVAELLKAKNFF